MTINEKCNICGRNEYSVIFKKNPQYSYEFIKCTNCSLVTIAPKMTKEQLGHFYDSEVHAINPLPDGDLKKANKKIRKMKGLLNKSVLFEKGYVLDEKREFYHAILGPIFKFFCLKRIPNYRGEGKILDIGCDNGLYLYILKSIGWKVYGLEVNSEGCKAAQSLGVECFNGALKDARYPDHFFDVIRIYHVLEHIPDPKALLLEMKRVSKPNGVIYLEVPNQRSFSFYVFKHVWHGRGSHLFAFSPDSFEKLCHAVGLKVEKTHIQTSAGKFCADLIAWSRSKRFWKTVFHPKVISTKIFKSFIAVPFCFVLNVLRLGDRYAAEITPNHEKIT